MIGINYDIGALFDAAFGFAKVAAFKMPRSIGSEGVLNGFTGVEVIRDDLSYDRMSQFGTPILGTIVFQGGNYKVYDDHGDPVDKSFTDFELPVATLVDIRRSKVMTTTPANAANSTTKEIFGFNDWQISMRGICLPDDNQPEGLFTPEEQKERLLEWEKVVAPIRIKGGLFVNKDIHEIVIESIDFRQLRGKPKVLPFQIRALSDEPKEFVI